MNDIIWKMVLSYNEAVFAGSPDTEAMRAALAAIPITEEVVEVVARTFFVAITPQYRLGEWQHQGFEDKVELHSAARAAITAFLADLQKEK